MKTIHFEDHGQDFLTWEVDQDGFVTDAQPFQSTIWGGCKVINMKELKPGGPVKFQSRHDGRNYTLLYPVEKLS